MCQNACTIVDKQRWSNKSYTFTAWKHGSRMTAIRQAAKELQLLRLNETLVSESACFNFFVFRRAGISLSIYFFSNVLHSGNLPDERFCVRKCAAINTCEQKINEASVRKNGGQQYN